MAPSKLGPVLYCEIQEDSPYPTGISYRGIGCLGEIALLSCVVFYIVGSKNNSSQRSATSSHRVKGGIQAAVFLLCLIEQSSQRKYAMAQ